MSSCCLPMRESSRSNGPSNSPTRTEKPTASGAPAGASASDGGGALTRDAAPFSGALLVSDLGDGTARHELAGEPTVALRRVVLGGEGRHRDAGHRGVRELDGA